MTRRKPRWELVTTDAGFHVRFRASNGRIVVNSEVYTTRRAALRVIALIANPHDARLTRVGVRTVADKVPPVEVREVDER